MTREEKVKAILQDERMMKEVFVDNVEQTLANLADRDVEMTVEELGELSVGILEGMGVNETELSENDLENVAGGFSPLKIADAALRDVIKAVYGGSVKGRKDKKNKSISGFSYVESANTVVGKGWRAIGYSIGYLLG